MSRIEDEVISKVLKRAEVGKKKYGNPDGMARNDLSRLEWLIHAQEEAMDLAVYLEKLIDEERKEEKSKACCCREGGIPKWTRTSSMDEFKEEKS